MQPKTALIWIGLVSVLAVAGLFWLIYGFEGVAADTDAFAFLPALNAFLNAASATFVILAIIKIKGGQKRTHGMLMIAATVASALFLVGYLLHHSLHGDTRFVREGLLRPVYFFILITHIVLAVVVLPMVLSTLYFAAAKRWESHKRLARWTYPVWIYVSVTGVLVFVFLRMLNTPPPVF